MLTQLHGIQTSPVLGPFREVSGEDWHKSVAEFPFLDFNTLVYDVARGANGNVVLFCPRLFNLAAFLVDGLRAAYPDLRLRIAHKRFGQWERIEIRNSSAIRDLRFLVPSGMETRVAVRERFSRFDGRNVLLTMNKDNPISWIADWVNYHKIHHNAQAVLLFDNGSTAYSREVLEEGLKEATGLSDILIVGADYPYGQSTTATSKGWKTIYIQTACLNLAKEIFLASANAVLSIDIDEFVEPIIGSDVFETTRHSMLGMLAWFGTWAYSTGASGPTPQRDHSLVSDQPRDTTRKWCVDPRRAIGRTEWMVHGHFGLYGLLTKTNMVHHWHFRHSNTSWREQRFDIPVGAGPSAALATALERI